MEKIKIGFLYLVIGSSVQIMVDEATGQKYLYMYTEDSLGFGSASGLTIMLDKNGNPDKFSPEEIEYLKSIAIDINTYKNYKKFKNDIQTEKVKSKVGYRYIEF